MAEYTIDKIEYGGNTYKLQDNVSGYTTNTGTLTSAVTSLTTTAGAHTTISNKTGATSIAIPTKTSHLTNDSGYITSYTDEKVKQISLNGTNSTRNLIVTPSGGTTGTITNTVAYARYLTYNDYSQDLTLTNSSNSTKQTSITSTSIQFMNGSYATILSAIAPTASRPIKLPDKDGTIALINDIPSASATTPKMDGTATVGTETAFARGDHIHPSDTSRVPTSRKVNDKALTSDITLDAFDIPWSNSGGDDTVQSIFSAAEDDIVDLQDAMTNKVDKVDGKGLSTNDYTTTEKNKLAGIASGAEVNVQADWNVTDSSSDAYIKNKPTISDEKVKQVVLEDSDNTLYGLITSYGSATSDVTNVVYSTSRITINNSTPSLTVGEYTGAQEVSIQSDKINFIHTEGNKQGRIKAPTTITENRTWTFPDQSGTVALTSDIPDDTTWNGVTLNKSFLSSTGTVYVPAVTSSGATTASYFTCTSTPTANKIARWDNSKYLYAVTPSAKDNSTKVATTEYVESAISTQVGAYLNYTIQSTTVSTGNSAYTALKLGEDSQTAVTLSAGRYLIFASVQFPGATSGNYGAAVLKNGSPLLNSRQTHGFTNTVQRIQTLSYTELDGTDTFGIGAFQTGASSQAITGYATWVRLRSN